MSGLPVEGSVYNIVNALAQGYITLKPSSTIFTSSRKAKRIQRRELSTFVSSEKNPLINVLLSRPIFGESP
ncbi:hypothetical protein M405DRAFT_868317 [Rhizopogon salebrosus TDB-379]|nr:hypothetical protein M405DRAFT_868317 [Rhizopogon salebrosus TDB-379]